MATGLSAASKGHAHHLFKFSFKMVCRNKSIIWDAYETLSITDHWLYCLYTVLWHVKMVWANKKRRYICDMFYHWLRPSSHTLRWHIWAGLRYISCCFYGKMALDGTKGLIWYQIRRLITVGYREISQPRDRLLKSLNEIGFKFDGRVDSRATKTPAEFRNVDIPTTHYNDVIMDAMASQIIGSRLFTQPFVQTQIKENSTAPRHWPLWGKFTGDRWIPLTKGQ